MNPLVLTSMAAVSTSIGGYCAVLLHRRVHMLMAFGAGVLVEAAFLDLLPSALSAAGASGSAKLLIVPIAALGALLILLYRRGDRASFRARRRRPRRWKSQRRLPHPA